jgi:hypothetical protein
MMPKENDVREMPIAMHAIAESVGRHKRKSRSARERENPCKHTGTKMVQETGRKVIKVGGKEKKKREDAGIKDANSRECPRRRTRSGKPIPKKLHSEGKTPTPMRAQ